MWIGILKSKDQVMREMLFNKHIKEYEDWFKKYPYVFKSEVAALAKMLPKGKSLHGIEIGLASGRFSRALGIKEGVEPAEKMRELAEKKRIFVLNAAAEDLPYKSLQFDFALMNFCISYFESIARAFSEAYRVLRHGGCLVVGFVDKNSTIGKSYEARKAGSIFYRHAKFYTVSKIQSELKKAGFKDLEFSQTLFHSLDRIKKAEKPLDGYGKGSYVIVKAIK
jgi:ubiquinone/menaquinone biosynthesis C-methylase UbiE